MQRICLGVAGDDLSTNLQGVMLDTKGCKAKSARTWVRVNFSSSDYLHLLPPRKGCRLQRWCPDGEPPRFQAWYPRNEGDTTDSKNLPWGVWVPSGPGVVLGAPQHMALQFKQGTVTVMFLNDLCNYLLTYIYIHIHTYTYIHSIFTILFLLRCILPSFGKDLHMYVCILMVECFYEQDILSFSQ